MFIGMLSSDPALLDRCAADLGERFGDVDLQSRPIPWDHSSYYEREMGIGLLRRFIAFPRNEDPGLLPAVKQEALRMEERWSTAGGSGPRRRVNLDPGYVTEAKVVLSTTKDFPHRVYIGGGVYAEATLQYARDRRSFIAVPHTYPDFQNDEALRFFNEVRDRLRRTLERERGASCRLTEEG